MQESSESISPFPGRGRFRIGAWIRETISTIVTEVTEAILDEDPVPLSPRGCYRLESAIPSLSAPGSTRPACSSDVIELLSSDSTYLNDPQADEKEEFEEYLVIPGKVRDLLRQFPSLQMRMDHHKMTAMADEGDRILKRILFKVEKLQTREKDEDDFVIVSSSSSVLIESRDSTHFVPLSD